MINNLLRNLAIGNNKKLHWKSFASDRIKWQKVVASIVSLSVYNYSVEFKNTYDANNGSDGLESN